MVECEEVDGEEQACGVTAVGKGKRGSDFDIGRLRRRSYSRPWSVGMVRMYWRVCNRKRFIIRMYYKQGRFERVVEWTESQDH